MSDDDGMEARCRKFAATGRDLSGQQVEWRVPFDGIRFALAFARQEVERERDHGYEYDMAEAEASEVERLTAALAAEKALREAAEQAAERRQRTNLELVELSKGLENERDAALLDAARLREALVGLLHHNEQWIDDEEPVPPRDHPGNKGRRASAQARNAHVRAANAADAALSASDSAAWLEARDAEIREQCAKACDSPCANSGSAYDDGFDAGRDWCAAAIRALGAGDGR